MEFFKNLSPEDFKEFMTILITLLVFGYLSLPLSYTDPAIRGSMLFSLGIIIKHYFDKNAKTV